MLYGLGLQVLKGSGSAQFGQAIVINAAAFGMKLLEFDSPFGHGLFPELEPGLDIAENL